MTSVFCLIVITDVMKLVPCEVGTFLTAVLRIGRSSHSEWMVGLWSVDTMMMDW